MNSQTFQDLNQRYFAGGLPRYQVIVAPQLHHASGRIAKKSSHLSATYISRRDAADPLARDGSCVRPTIIMAHSGERR